MTSSYHVIMRCRPAAALDGVGLEADVGPKPFAAGDPRCWASPSSTRIVARRSCELTSRSSLLTAASTVPCLAALIRAPRAVSRRTALRRSPGSSTRRNHRCATSRCNTPVKVLGCTCRMVARSPADTPGTRPITRSASLWGPVTPRSPAMRFEVFSRPCTTAHNTCMNWSTSGRLAVTSPRRVLFVSMAIYFELKTISG